MLGGFVSFGFFFNFCLECVGSGFSKGLDVLCIDQLDRLSLAGFQSLDILLGLTLDLFLEEVNLLNILLMLESHELL